MTPDFKNKMMGIIREEASACKPPIVSCMDRIDENGYKGISYNDWNMSKAAFGTHSKDKDSFYVKRAKQQEVNDAYEKARVRRQEQKEYREKKYQASQYLKDVLAHQDEVARLFEEKYNTSGVI